jgi:heme/copper-type cytochrome/quinol oxidase subunit 3
MDAGKVRRLPDSDVDGRKSFGMSLVLLASTMTFGGLLVLYALLRHEAPAWTTPTGASLALVATGAIAASSATLHLGVRALLHARPRALPRCLVATIVLGLAFLAIEIRLWLDLWEAGFVFGTLEAGTFYLLTGFHFVHVLLAVSLVSWLVPGALRERYHARNHVRVRLIARFWHFLGINWALLYVALFLW